MYPKGFILNGTSCGIKKNSLHDIGIIYSNTPCTYAGVFTKNTIQAAPVKLCKERLTNTIHGLVVNSGCANSFTGKRGLDDAYSMTNIMANELDHNSENFLCLSTGVIGEHLPMDNIKKGIVNLAKSVGGSINDPNSFARSIMTTDTRAKQRSMKLSIGDKVISIYGAVKGSGMIFPNMATMLAFIVTDIAISDNMLNRALAYVADITFNSISVDGDMSTNDSVILLANGEANNNIIDEDNEDYYLFRSMLEKLSLYLAKEIVRDGEGATKFIEIVVKGALSPDDAFKCASHLSNSLLVKTAFFGEDPNWGRFIYAIGASGCSLVEKKINIKLGDITLVKNGERTNFTEKQASTYMKNHDLYLEINLNMGTHSKTMYTTDLSYDYIRINADYRS